MNNEGKPLSETLREAAADIEQLSRAHLAILLRRAAAQLATAEASGLELEDAANDDQPES